MKRCKAKDIAYRNHLQVRSRNTLLDGVKLLWIWVVSAEIPTTVLIPISTGPYSTNPARLLHIMHYRSPKDR